MFFKLTSAQVSINSFGRRTWAVLALMLGGASAVLAQSACVRCSGPEELYACSVSSETPVPDETIGLYCASRIANEYRHQSCAAQRVAEICEGLRIDYVYEEQKDPQPVKAEDLRWRNPERKAKTDEPETLGEFAADTVDASAKTIKKAGENIGDAAGKAGKATGDAIKNTGEAIGNATKKTLKCLGSALNDC